MFNAIAIKRNLSANWRDGFLFLLIYQLLTLSIDFIEARTGIDANKNFNERKSGILHSQLKSNKGTLA